MIASNDQLYKYLLKLFQDTISFVTMSSIASSILTQTARRQALRTATSARTPFVIVPAFRQLSTSRVAAMPMNEYNKPVATIDVSLPIRMATRVTRLTRSGLACPEAPCAVHLPLRSQEGQEAHI